MGPSDNSLDLADVRERFEKSAASLEAVNTQARELAAQAESRAASTESLSDASRNLSEFTTSIASVVEGLRAAQESAEATFTAMRSVADGTDLKELKEMVEGLSSEVASTTELEAKIEDLQAKLDEAIAEKTSLADELAASQSQLEKLKVAAGSRALKKAGMA
jgi:predicted nuclease with TOPRIM domain